MYFFFFCFLLQLILPTKTEGDITLTWEQCLGEHPSSDAD